MSPIKQHHCTVTGIVEQYCRKTEILFLKGSRTCVEGFLLRVLSVFHLHGIREVLDPCVMS